jgi:hypothetical protein
MRSRLFASGFRPTFLAAAVAAAVLIPLWVLIWGFGWSLSSSWPPTLWHAHEMVFGFIAAAIGGFLLTAVPSWTGQRGFGGPPLVLVVALWLAARILIATSSHWPGPLVAAVDGLPASPGRRAGARFRLERVGIALSLRHRHQRLLLDRSVWSVPGHLCADPVVAQGRRQTGLK